MTAYITTPEQHAQIVDALSIRDVRLHESALAMLKAMQPVEPVATYSHKFLTPERSREFVGFCDSEMATDTPLYTPTKD